MGVAAFAGEEVWTVERVNLLKKLWNDGLSASQMSAELGVTRNAIIGKVHRLGLSGRVARKSTAAPSARAWNGGNAKRANTPEIATGTPGPGPSTDPVVKLLRGAVTRATSKFTAGGMERQNAPAKVTLPTSAPKIAPPPIDEDDDDDQIDSEATELQDLPTEARGPHSVDLFGLTEKTCRWPCGTPGTADFFFCGVPEADHPRAPYCHAHARIAGQRVRRMTPAEIARREAAAVRWTRKQSRYA